MKKKIITRLIAWFSGSKLSWRWLLPIVLVLLFLSILLWLPREVQRMETNERQQQLIADTLWVEQTIRFQLDRDGESIRLIGSDIIAGTLSSQKLLTRAAFLIESHRELQNLIWLDADDKLVAISNSEATRFNASSPSSRTAAEKARRTRIPQYSQPDPTGSSKGLTLMEYHVPLFDGDRYLGRVVAIYGMRNILDEMVPWWFAQENEILLVDSDDAVLGRRTAGGVGRGVYTHRRSLDLPGVSISLSVNSVKPAPNLLPNLLVGSVILLSIGLVWSLLALWRDIARRLAAEGALRQQVSFRTAMENSLVTGLRARDLDGRVTYVNPAFCHMVGLSQEQLIGKSPPMPYWAPEAMADYQQRIAQVLAGTVTPQGFETIFQRADGERFPVLIFESPLVDDSGKQTGWMGSILDISDRRRIEELNHRQQEKLQASARLASMGEITSTLAHELNQPLSAISSYTTGALNILSSDAMQNGTVDFNMLRAALEKANGQAQRAGHIIRSVHEFVKKRELAREPVAMQELFDSLFPLIELQAHQFFVTVQVEIAPRLPTTLADRVLLEQVLLNLTRNAIESMQHVAPERRLLHLTVVLDSASSPHSNIIVSVIDQGHGISEEVADRLFSPFFSTKAEGMGMGLNICRSAIEFHGGTLKYEANPAGGTIFQFSLPVMSKNLVVADKATVHNV
jgi:two-component system sensor histidine kinase DctS